MGDICGAKIPGRSCRRLRYWSMLSVGTDGCRHLSSLRWDSGPYFEADKDCVWKWRWVCDLAIIGICFEARAFWKPKKSEQRCNEDVRKDIPTTLAIGQRRLTFPTLYRIGESPGLGDWSLVCIFDVESSRSIKVKKRRDGRCLIVCWFASKWRNNKLFPGYWHWCRKVM